jgi:hypothetical protein
MSPMHTETTQYLAALSATSASGIAAIALGIIGTFAIVLLAARSLAAYADDRHGRMVTLIVAAVPIFFICYFPDQTVNILKALGTTFFGG